MQSPPAAFRGGIWIGGTQGLCVIPAAAPPRAEGHRKVVRSRRKLKVMGAISGVIHSYFGRLAAISLGPLRLYYVGGVRFWEHAHQRHISTRQSMDHFCLGNDICSLALKTNRIIFRASNV